MPDLAPLVESIGTLVGPAVKAMLKTTLGAVVLTILTAAASVLVASDGSWLRGALGAAVAIGLGVMVGGLLAVKRAILEALSSGVRRLALGRRSLGALTQGMVAVDDEEEWKERGGSLVQRAERLPLAQAERRFRKAIAETMSERARYTGVRGG